ncbi:uncharacterized protein [Dermacentor andersoni]|uniref:uncharacterized protein n=1 Tax=Dermacentor andersoni TaxID=34620 RepID=UPI00241626EE|nr:uncharacterized protein LOC129384364 [Dermacentor andersoni]
MVRKSFGRLAVAVAAHILLGLVGLEKTRALADETKVPCTPEACHKSCQDSEPKKKVLNTTCPESNVCHCIYEVDCTEDNCRDYCKENVTSNDLKGSMCIQNFCYCNKTTGDMRRSETDDISHSGFHFSDARNSFIT